MQFIPIVETDKTDPSQAAPFSVTPDKFGEFLCKIWDLWIADFKNGIPTTSVRHFDSVFHTYVGLQAPECTLHKECGVYVVIEHNGDVYSCDFFVEPNWKLGNIMKDKIINLLNSKKQDQFGKIKAYVPPPCRRCNWYRHCFGGCTKDGVRDPRDKGISHFCLSYKVFFAHADTGLRRLAEDWKKKQLEEYKKETKGTAEQISRSGGLLSPASKRRGRQKENFVLSIKLKKDSHYQYVQLQLSETRGKNGNWVFRSIFS